MKYTIFIINPAASGGHAQKVWSKVKNELECKEISYRSYFTEYPGHAKLLVTQIVSINVNSIQAIIAVGGDGTISEIVNGLSRYRSIPIGFIPAGSGNDFARGFGIPQTVSAALAPILDQSNDFSRFDVGTYQLKRQKKRHYFINSIGIGFDALVSKAANQSKMKKYLNKLHLGKLIYVFVLLRELFSYKRTELILTVDGNEYHYQNVWFVTVSNQKYYGGGMKISPQADPTDGQLNITVVHGLAPLKFLCVFTSVFVGKHIHFKEVTQHIGRLIKIDTEQNSFVHADGEFVGVSPVTLGIELKNIRLKTSKD